MRLENGIFVLLKGAGDSHFPLVLEREYAFLSLSSLCLSFSLILFLPEFSTCLSLFSDSVITRVYYILLLEDGLLFAFSASLSILLRVFLSQRLFLSLSFSLSFCYYVKFYSDSDSDSTLCNSPSS